MNTKHLALVAAWSIASVPALAGTFFGLRLNFGGPRYAPAPAVYQPGTAVVVEPAVPSPGPGYFWIAGHWDWDGRGWVWRNGRWAMPPRFGAQWSPGHWVQDHQGWLWADGAWIVPTPSAAAPSAPALPTSAPVSEIYVTQAPPPPVVEAIPLCPGPDFVWIGGSWAWRGSWTWTSGYYYHRPVGFSSWTPGFWDHRAAGWAWTRGCWR